MEWFFVAIAIVFCLNGQYPSQVVSARIDLQQYRAKTQKRLTPLDVCGRYPAGYV